MTDASPSPDPESSPNPVLGPPCRHLRTKGMYVYTDGQNDPNAADDDDDFDTSIYWCMKSMTNIGPDDALVCRPDCRNPERSCYEPL